MQHGLFGHVMPLALASVSSGVDTVINGILPILSSRWLKWSSTWLFFIIWWYWHQCHIISMKLWMVYDINAKTWTSTGTKCHIYTIISITEMLWCLWCDKKHFIAVYRSKTHMPLNYHIQTNHMCQLAHMRTMSVYMCLMNPVQLTMWPATQMYIHFT